MKVLVSMLDLKNDEKLIDEYLTAHKNVEPAITKRMDEYGIILAQVRRYGDRLAQVILVNDDFDGEGFNRAIDGDPDCVRWNEDMKAYQKKIPSAKPEEWWSDAETAFDFHNWANWKK